MVLGWGKKHKKLEHHLQNKEVIKIAITALVNGETCDYRPALLKILQSISPEMYNLLKQNEGEAYSMVNYREKFMDKITDFRVQCDCHSHELHVTHDEDFISITIWRDGYTSSEYGLKDKLRHIWQIIRHGTPWVDMVLLNKESSKKLGEHLIKASEDLKESESVFELKS